MKIAIVPPQISLDLAIANVAATPPRIDWPAAELDSTKVEAWFHATAIPDGVNAINIPMVSSPWIVEDIAAGTEIAGVPGANGITALHFLRVAVRRKTGGTAAISANTVTLTTTPAYAVTSVSTSTGLITLPQPHGLNIGDAVQVSASALPTGLSAATDYFLIASGFTPTAFKLSATRGGAAIVPSSSGTAVKINPGRQEIGRLHVAAAGAGYEPVCVPFLWYSNSAHPEWSGPDFTLWFADPAAAAELTLEIQAAGED
jgi:hypothetical protein